MTTATITIEETAAYHIDRAIGHYTPSGTKWHPGMRRRRVTAEQANAALETIKEMLATMDVHASVHSMRTASALNRASAEIRRAIAKLSKV